MFAQDQSSYSGFPLFVLSGKSENSKFSYNPLKATQTHIYTHREKIMESVFILPRMKIMKTMQTGAPEPLVWPAKIFS